MDMKQLVTNVTISKTCSIKSDIDSTESKQVTLNVRFNGVPLQAVFDKAVSQSVIQWQNGPGRRNFDTWKRGQIVDIDFKSPGRQTIDPETAIKAKLAGMDTKAERLAYIESLMGESEG